VAADRADVVPKGAGYESARARAADGIARASKQWDEQQRKASDAAGHVKDSVTDQVRFQ